MKNIMQFVNKPGDVSVDGKYLVADFQSAIANLVTMQTARYAAEQSEDNTLQTIQTASTSSNGVYITPHDISGAAQEALVRSSLDAHIKKVQAQQIATYTAAQVDQMEADDVKKYTGKKIQVNVLDANIGAVESYWFDSKTGQESRGVIKANLVKGTIQELSFQKNLLVIKPLFTSRVLLSARKFFLISIINPETLAPLVDIKLI